MKHLRAFLWAFCGRWWNPHRWDAWFKTEGVSMRDGLITCDMRICQRCGTFQSRNRQPWNQQERAA